MEKPPLNKKLAPSSPDAEKARRLSEQRAADRETRRQIEEANREAAERLAAYQARIDAKNAALRADAEEKKAAAQAKADAKAKAAQEKAEAKALVAQEKERAKKAAEEAKAEAAKKKKELQSFKATLRDESRRQSKEHGAPLAELIGTFLHVFSARKDIHVLALQEGEATGLATLIEHQALPVEVLAWYHARGALEFRWGWDKDGPAVGVLNVPSLEGNLDWTQTSLEALVLAQVPRAFLNQVDEENLSRLLNSSARRFSTTACLTDALLEKGIDLKQAKRLLGWLGEHARVLVHHSETPFGLKREELLAQALDSDTELNRSLLNALNAGPALEKRHWKELLTAHEKFLDTEAAPPAIEVTMSRGLPLASVTQCNDNEGRLLLNHENFTGANFTGARLASAGLVGIRAEKVNFSSADLSQTCLAYSALPGAKFSSANLTGCDLSHAILIGADFRGADLSGTNFEGANLEGANFAGAVTRETKFRAAHMRGVKY